MVRVGFLMLDTRFPRGVGDAGCAATWDFPVAYYVVPGSFPRQVVCSESADYLPDFIDGGVALVRQGVGGIATTCGFLCLHQRALAAALPVPVLTSALLMGEEILAALPAEKKLGILSVSPDDLSKQHLLAAGIDPQRAIIGGLRPDCALADSLLNNRETLDVEQARADMSDAAADLSGQAALGAVLLECANMPPYTDTVKRRVGVPVFSVIDAVNNFYRRLITERRHKSHV